MKPLSFIIIFLLITGILIGSPVYGVPTDETKKDASESMVEQLLPLKPFLGKTWRGVIKGSTPMVDVAHWERALNGHAVRILHSLNNGIYGGETIIMWDPQKESLVFFYFTTAGFFTQGTIKFENDKYISHEYVTGNKQGITEVKATGEKLPDGTMHTKSLYLKEGKWVDGHEIIYEEDPNAKVIFK